jgi:hypothetical protein
VSHPSFETLASQAPQDEVGGSFTALIYPTGKSSAHPAKSKSSPFRKNILIFRNRKSVYIYRHPASQEGRFAVVTKVDAGCDGRGCAFDEWH